MIHQTHQTAQVQRPVIERPGELRPDAELGPIVGLATEVGARLAIEVGSLLSADRRRRERENRSTQIGHLIDVEA